MRERITFVLHLITALALIGLLLQSFQVIKTLDRTAADLLTRMVLRQEEQTRLLQLVCVNTLRDQRNGSMCLTEGRKP